VEEDKGEAIDGKLASYRDKDRENKR